MKQALHAIAILVMASFIIPGCSTIDPYTGEKKTSKATWGTAIGAASGAAVGMIAGHNSKQRRRNALIGAGVGALAGAGIGNYMDQQEAKLRQKLQGSGVSVTRQGDRIILNMPGNITFRTGSADINAGFFEALNSVALVLKEYPKTILDIYGHTDSVGDDASNQALSERRAAAVGQYLVSQGVDSMRIATQGFGETKPIASNDTEAGKQQNRRVELEISPLTQQ
ncbi:MAG TPA: OmpA family protein [Deltaproteobacteria bacterium]|nr:OmpA family protein [Deltaproteobacteria bacterium]